MTNENLEIAEVIESKTDKEIINSLRKIMSRNDRQAFKNESKKFEFKNNKYNSFI